MQALSWRQLGPFRGGRVSAVAGHPTNPLVFYFGAAAGGVFKTDDAGLTWQNISDSYFQTASVGALAVAPSDPRTIYAGMGEACIRGNVSYGDGVYRSDDGGETWTHRGLADTRHIGRVRVHPHDPDTVYVAALGHAFGPHRARGVYRSRDGGAHWDQVLFRDDTTGAIDLVMDPQNPDVLYAACWDVRRYPWTLRSGGPGSSVFKTADGGDTWTEISTNPGFPTALKGRIGVALSPARPHRVWSVVEAADGAGGLYRSDDGGAHWERLTDQPDLRQRPWYYMHLFADPVDPETLYVLNLGVWVSHDGGRHFDEVSNPYGDNHDLWIDPHDPARKILGNDGGATVTLNDGRTWSTIFNQPTAQFYHVVADNQDPYRLYGAQQDNTTLSVPSRSDHGNISMADCYEVGGGESGYIAVRPDNPAIVYAGSYASRMTRYDHARGEQVDITVWPEDPIGYGAGDLRYRFQWTFPIVLSPHDPDCLYATGNQVFRSRDGGQSWEVVSPDLTRHDPETLRSSGGPITQDNVSTEYYGTIFAFAASPVSPNILWAGSDDGLVHVSQDGGASWQAVTPPDLPEWALVSLIEASPHDAGTAYVAATRYKLDDPAPYLYRTTDYGRTWAPIVTGIRAGDFTRAIREDPVRPGMLYAGTETGAYVSWDQGQRWHALGGNLPVVPVHDLIVAHDDLVLATHGRAFWVLDDVTPLRTWPDRDASTPVYLSPPRPACRRSPGWTPRAEVGQRVYVGSGVGHAIAEVRRDPGASNGKALVPLTAGENPPDGAVVTYWLDSDTTPVALRFDDAEGQLIQEFASTDTDDEQKAKRHRVGTGAGLHRFVWDLRYPDASKLDDSALSPYWGGSLRGPVALPGTYRVTVTAGDHHQTQTFEVRADPRSAASPQDLQAQFDLLMQIRHQLTAIHELVRDSRRVRTSLDRWATDLASNGFDALARAARVLSARLVAAEGTLVESRGTSRADSFNYPPQLNSKIASLESTVSYGPSRPPAQCYAVFNTLRDEADTAMAELRSLMTDDTAALTQQLREAQVPLIG